MQPQLAAGAGVAAGAGAAATGLVAGAAEAAGAVAGVAHLRDFPGFIRELLKEKNATHQLRRVNEGNQDTAWCGKLAWGERMSAGGKGGESQYLDR